MHRKDSKIGPDDLEEILSIMKEAKKRKLNLPLVDLDPKENGEIYEDIVRYLKLLEISPNIEILSIASTRSGVPSDELVRYLFDDGFISYDICDDTIETFLDSLTVPLLKNILDLHGLKKSGKKQELVERIIDNDIKFKNKTGDVLFTKKAIQFLDEWGWIIDYGNFFWKVLFSGFFLLSIRKGWPY